MISSSSGEPSRVNKISLKRKYHKYVVQVPPVMNEFNTHNIIDVRNYVVFLTEGFVMTN